MGLRIALDATAIPANRAGAGVYILELVRGLAAVDRQNHYFIYCKPDHVCEIGIDQENFKLIPVPEANSTWKRLLWEQISLPTGLRRLGIDVLHSPHYTMPMWKACRNVVTLHDMSFFLMPGVHSKGRRLFFCAIMPCVL